MPLFKAAPTTRIEQQDAWLLQLYAPPVASDAYYAGWGRNRRNLLRRVFGSSRPGIRQAIRRLYGQALLQSISGPTLKIGYTSNFWGSG